MSICNLFLDENLLKNFHLNKENTYELETEFGNITFFYSNAFDHVVFAIFNIKNMCDYFIINENEFLQALHCLLKGHKILIKNRYRLTTTKMIYNALHYTIKLYTYNFYFGIKHIFEFGREYYIVELIHKYKIYRYPNGSILPLPIYIRIKYDNNYYNTYKNVFQHLKEYTHPNIISLNYHLMIKDVIDVTVLFKKCILDKIIELDNCDEYVLDLLNIKGKIVYIN